MGEDLDISRDRVLAGITISLYIYAYTHSADGPSHKRGPVYGALFLEAYLEAL